LCKMTQREIAIMFRNHGFKTANVPSSHDGAWDRWDRKAKT
jgi:hypothetical protein